MRCVPSTTDNVDMARRSPWKFLDFYVVFWCLPRRLGLISAFQEFYHLLFIQLARIWMRCTWTVKSWDGILGIVDSFLYWTNWGESESKNEAIHEALTLWIAEMAW